MLVLDVVLGVILQRALVAVLAGEHIVEQAGVVELGPVEGVAQACAALLFGAQRELKVVEVRLVEGVVFAPAVDPVEAGVDAPLLVHRVRDMRARKEVVAEVKPVVIVDGRAQLLARELCGDRGERRHVKVLVALPVVVVIAVSAPRAILTEREVVELIFVREERPVHRVCQIRAKDALRARHTLEMHMGTHVRLIVQQDAINAPRAGVEVHMRRARLLMARIKVGARLQIGGIEYRRGDRKRPLPLGRLSEPGLRVFGAPVMEGCVGRGPDAGGGRERARN